MKNLAQPGYNKLKRIFMNKKPFTATRQRNCLQKVLIRAHLKSIPPTKIQKQ